MNVTWTCDRELFALARRELFTAVVGDIMDKLGFLHQFLPPRIQPLRRDMVAVGRAMTVLEADITEEGDSPFGLMLDALDDLKPDEIYLCSGASPAYALWGELMSTRARACGAVGAVLNGYTRDTSAILEMDFPTFAYGSYAQDQAPRGKVADFRVPLVIEGTRVDPGDIVFADIDGVCVVPRAAEQEVFIRALEKARREKTAKKALESGRTAREVFADYDVL